MRSHFILVFWIASLILVAGCGKGSHGSSGTTALQTANSAPTLAIDNPTSDLYYLSSAKPLSVSGTALDDAAVTKVVWASSRGYSGDATGTEVWSVAGIPLEEGDNAITITAYDTQGLSAEQVLLVTYNEYLLFHGEPEADPFALVTGVSTEVIVRTTILPNPNLIAGSVKLLRVDGSGAILQDLGPMYDDGDLNHGDDIKGDAVFSTKITLLEPTAGDVHLRIVASTQELSGKIEAFSQMFLLTVVNPVDAAEALAAVSIQQEAQTKFYTALQTASREDALASTLAWLKSQATVLDASVTQSHDIWVVFGSGLTGLIFCGEEGNENGGMGSTPAGREGLATDTPLREQTPGAPIPAGSARSASSSADPDAVLNTNAILYGAFYSEYSGMGQEFLNSLKTRLDNSKAPKFKYIYLKDAAADVDALADLPSYGLVALHSHGGLDDKGDVIIMTGEEFSVESFDKHMLRYLAEQLTMGTINGKTYWSFKPRLIKKLRNNFPNSIIYMGACSTMKNATLSSAFLGKGANTCFGFSAPVKASFDKWMANQLFALLIDDHKKTGEAFTPDQHDTQNPPAYFLMAGNEKAYFMAGLINGDFETGDLTGWTTSGDGRIIAQLSFLQPWEKTFMGIISTGLGFTESSGSISQEFWVDPSCTMLGLQWNFISEEFMEWVGSQYQDYFQIVLTDEQGYEQTLLKLTIDDCANNYSLTKVSPDIVFDKGDVYMTGWQYFQFSLLPWAGTQVTLRLKCGDVGDSIYDTAILLDAISMDP
ncbi:MAG: choice-of-anchor L domain-containing protein [Planctomycetota bacterium]